VKTAGKHNQEKTLQTATNSKIEVVDTNDNILLNNGEVSIIISKHAGTLVKASNQNGSLPLSGGPFLCNNQPKLTSITHNKSANGYVVYAKFDKNTMEVKWEMQNNGLVTLDVGYQTTDSNEPFSGISFNCAEETIQKVTYLGKGPYRVWKNRMAGPTFGIWEKTYNNTITGYKYDGYPEFKGYFSNLYWAKFNVGNQQHFTVFSKTDDLFLRLFTPEDGQDAEKTVVKHPKGDISFLNGIPAIGTKSKFPEQLGPQSQTYQYAPKRVENGKLQVSLIFDFTK
jgi:hypothetical protein